ncbi:hypothetical protein STEG23_035720 [Scotinomys teguina]
MQPGRTTNTCGRTMEVKAVAPRCQLLLILLMSVVMLLPGTNGSLLLVQRTVTRTIVSQETIGKVIQTYVTVIQTYVTVIQTYVTVIQTYVTMIQTYVTVIQTYVTVIQKVLKAKQNVEQSH